MLLVSVDCDDPPTVAAIELESPLHSIEPREDAVVSLAASDYFSLPLHEQTLACPISPVFAKHP